MSDSYKNGFEFVVKIDTAKRMILHRRNDAKCYCPFTSNQPPCGSWCPHFVVENCSIVDKKCSLILTCGKYILRLVEIVD
jgi:hypothetical protein